MNHSDHLQRADGSARTSRLAPMIAGLCRCCCGGIGSRESVHIFGQHWPESAIVDEIPPMLAELRSMLIKLWPTSTRLCQSLVTFGPTLANLGRNWPAQAQLVGRKSPTLGGRDAHHTQLVCRPHKMCWPQEGVYTRQKCLGQVFGQSVGPKISGQRRPMLVDAGPTRGIRSSCSTATGPATAETRFLRRRVLDGTAGITEARAPISHRAVGWFAVRGDQAAQSTDRPTERLVTWFLPRDVQRHRASLHLVRILLVIAQFSLLANGPIWTKIGQH